MKLEEDSFGTVEVPDNALYKAQTQRAVNNFDISGQRMPDPFITAVVRIKQAAAKVNQELGLLPVGIAGAIDQACGQILDGDVDFDLQFPVGVFQTGSGTSTNMNVNEVLASLASEIAQQPVHPNDHVNMGQSSNDVIPSAIHLSAAVQMHGHLTPSLNHLATVIETKMAQATHITKTGRTHLMDAMPITLAQELSAWAAQIHSGIDRLQSTQARLYRLAQGGTAVGTGINAHPNFATGIARHLSDTTGLPFTPNPVFFEALACQDTAVELSGQLKVVAVSLMKIANDLRWMNSGPLSGLGEIELKALQPGSSIMPGKVNPVIPEAVAMAAAQVIGNDAAITIAGQSGNFQLNVMLPLIADNLLESIGITANASRALADRAIGDFQINETNIAAGLVRNPILVTALNARIGYAQAAKIAKTAYATQRPVFDVALELTDLNAEELETLLDPHVLTRGGIP